MNESSASDFQTAAHLYCTEADYDAAFPLMKKCAEGGHPSACFLLALMYRSGRGTTRDDEQYEYWLARLLSIAEQGDPLAQWEVSCSFRWADHFPLDIERANYWLEKAAEGGHAEAQHLLAWYYEYGLYDYPIDRAASEDWYQRAFRQGHPETLYTFALREFKGGQATANAIALLKRAADKGFTQAADVLRMYTH